MKKILLAIVLSLLLIGPAIAQEWYTANQITVAWDASDGSTVDPVIPQNEISYYVYLSNFMTDQNKENPTRIGETGETQFVITLADSGQYMVGVSAIRTVEGEVVGESEITWSDTSDPPFGIRFYGAPPAPTSLRIQ